ncbi:hypothetical protein [Mesorhizobium sp.]|uniref:hypothetical protein n=1 Tax=Mesorhizobium sp. TaxID=1871066 RepID=UPI0025BE5847|nr:hypothetical protein [Mesorhizobium sp.]
MENQRESDADRLHVPAAVDDHLLQGVELRRMLVGIPDANLDHLAFRRDARIKVEQPRQPSDGLDDVLRGFLAGGINLGKPSRVEAGARDADDGGCRQ